MCMQRYSKATVFNLVTQYTFQSVIWIRIRTDPHNGKPTGSVSAQIRIMVNLLDPYPHGSA